MMKLYELPLEGQGQDARVTATVTAELGLQGQAARGQVVRAGLGLVGSYGGGRWLTTDGKSFSLKLLDLPLILNVTGWGPSSFASMWHCFSCSDADWRSIGGQGVPEAKSAPWSFYNMGFFLTILPIPLSSCSQSLPFVFLFNHFSWLISHTCPWQTEPNLLLTPGSLVSWIISGQILLK